MIKVIRSKFCPQIFYYTFENPYPRPPPGTTTEYHHHKLPLDNDCDEPDEPADADRHDGGSERGQDVAQLRLDAPPAAVLEPGAQLPHNPNVYGWGSLAALVELEPAQPRQSLLLLLLPVHRPAHHQLQYAVAALAVRPPNADAQHDLESRADRRPAAGQLPPLLSAAATAAAAVGAAIAELDLALRFQESTIVVGARAGSAGQ